MTQSLDPSPTPQSATTSTAVGGRPPNWTREEDVALCKAWINVSTDAIVGTGQKQRAFWERVHTEFSSTMQGTRRVAKGCENRWGKLYPEVSKWSAAITRVHAHLPSGSNLQDEFGAARQFFYGEHNHYFKFEHCWEVLRDCRKWQEYRDARKAARGGGSSRIPSRGNRTPHVARVGPSQSASGSFNPGVDSFDNSLQEPLLNTQRSGSPVSATPKSFDIADNTFPLEKAVEGTSERPIGRKAAKNQRLQKRGSNSDASSVVGDRIVASFALMKESSQLRWEKFSERYKEETFYNINAMKLQMVRDRAAIEESIIRSEKELISMDPTWLSTEADKAKLISDRKRKLAELEAEAEALRSWTYSPGGSSRRATMGRETSGAACNLTARLDEEL